MSPVRRKREKAQSSPLAERQRLQEVVDEERRGLRQLERRREELAREADAKRAAVVAAYRDERSAERAKKEQRAHDEKRGDLNLRIEAKRQRVREAEAAVERFVGENINALAEEKVDAEDKPAQAAVQEGVARLLADIQQIEAAAAAWDELLRESGGYVPANDGAPPLHLDRLRKELEAVLANGVRQPTATPWGPRFDGVVGRSPQREVGEGIVRGSTGFAS